MQITLEWRQDEQQDNKIFAKKPGLQTKAGFNSLETKTGYFFT
jgi:hypothetical protein